LPANSLALRSVAGKARSYSNGLLAETMARAAAWKGATGGGDEMRLQPHLQAPWPGPGRNGTNPNAGNLLYSRPDKHRLRIGRFRRADARGAYPAYPIDYTRINISIGQHAETLFVAKYLVNLAQKV